MGLEISLMTGKIICDDCDTEEEYKFEAKESIPVDSMIHNILLNLPSGWDIDPDQDYNVLCPEHFAELEEEGDLERKARHKTSIKFF